MTDRKHQAVCVGRVPNAKFLKVTPEARPPILKFSQVCENGKLARQRVSRRSACA